jgi:putative aminopeptidase FrvX
MRLIRRPSPRCTAVALCLSVVPAAAQPPRSAAMSAGEAGYAAAVTQWIALPAAPGHEAAATDIIAASLSGWTRDSSGNVTVRRGSGLPRRVVACGLDEASYVVSEITDDGYLRLHMDGRARRSALWDQFHEGQRVRIITHAGSRPAVVAVRSTHLWRTRPAAEVPSGVEDLWVDAGARSRDEVARMGIEVLDPVMREWPSWRVADYVAGPAAGSRASCAAVAAAAQRAPTSGETIWVISARHTFGYAGLAAVLARLDRVDSLYIVDPSMARDAASPVGTIAHQTLLTSPDAPWVATRRAGATVAIGVPVMFAGTLAESVRDADIAALIEDVSRAAGVGLPTNARAVGAASIALRGVPSPPAFALGTDALSEVATVLGVLSDIYGVSGREDSVRSAVIAALPSAWKRQPTHVDSAGDVILEAGPDRDTTVIVAHLDEIGFVVTHVTHAGMVSVAPLGGFYPSLWEGQPALAHLEASAAAGAAGSRCAGHLISGGRADGASVGRSALAGLFVPREHATTKQPDSLSVWFGIDSAGLAACGVTAGVRISGHKVASRLGDTRFTARSLDDRVGCTALLLALRALDPTKLAHKVIFVWSVREEVGLEGAAAAAHTFGKSTRRVYAIDTFVSSDSPLENHRFAYAPIGSGAALRALDNSSVTPPSDVARIVKIASRAGIPLQVGTTNGGNDGSVFVPWGATDVPIGWPLRYSHSPAEVIDLRDVDALARMVKAVAEAAD